MHESTRVAEENEVRALYERLLEAWNRRDAAAMAALFTEDASVVGFDGSQMNGRGSVADETGRIFHDHQTAAYVGKVRDVRFLAPQVAILRAVVGMVPPGKTDLNPAVNAIQSLVSVKTAGRWLITLFQNTPAQFHDRPDLADQLTDELRQVVKNRPVGRGVG